MRYVLKAGSVHPSRGPEGVKYTLWEPWPSVTSLPPPAPRGLRRPCWRSRRIILRTFEWVRPVSTEIQRVDWCVRFVLLTKHEVLFHLLNVPVAILRAQCGLPLPGCRAINYRSCGFSSADSQCFHVSNPCREIHSTTFVHHTALTHTDVSSESHLPVKFS